MILPYKTKFDNGEPTKFIEKIWSGIVKYNLLSPATVIDFFKTLSETQKPLVNLPAEILAQENPKIHTIREDKHNRWRIGIKIHSYVFNRTKNMFMFAPILKCKAVQDINIVYGDHRIDVFIDCKYYDGISMYDDTVHEKLLPLVQNDGFNSVEDFFGYFNKDFAGKIIHWTELTY